MNLLALSFVHPALLGGFALASLPIVIHILNRRRARVVEWGAM
ncbi:MAG: BatA domain-containing protein, partial [Planctomycetota bacterium]